MAASDAFRSADDAPGRDEATAGQADLSARRSSGPRSPRGPLTRAAGRDRPTAPPRHTLARSSARSSWMLTLPFAAAYGLLALLVPLAPSAAAPATVTLTVLVVPLAVGRWLRWLFRYGRSALVSCPGHLELMYGSRWTHIPWDAVRAVHIVPGDRHAALVPPARPPRVVLHTARGEIPVPLLLLRRKDADAAMDRLRTECAHRDIPVS